MFVATATCTFLAVVLFLVPPAFSADSTTNPGEFFENRIRPLWANNCLFCHGESRLGGLQLDSREHLLKGGNSGPAIIPGKPDESLLIQAVSHTHPRLRMPPQGKLKNEEIADITNWIRMGAPWPNTVTTAAPAGKEYVITPEQRNFWAFQPVRKPTLPKVKDKDWPKSLIDYFVLSQLEAHDLKPVRKAEKQLLIRRATLNLIGLPPKPEDVQTFLQDSSQNAFAKVINRLLASPQYGERWGRYWLDVARYAEDDAWGKRFPNAYRYRDWVIQAFNDDMPYDLFLKAQIAADVLPGEDREKLIPGLGFFGIGPRYQEIIEPAKAIAEECNDRVDTMTRGFLGLTVACARCHDHKYDPISMKDYYGLSGVFASSEYREYPLAPKSVIEDYYNQQRRIQDTETIIKEFLQGQSVQLAEILARQTSRYILAAWKVLGPLKSELEKVAKEEKLDSETLRRWVKYLTKMEKDHEYVRTWDNLLKKEATFEAAKRVAGELQASVKLVIKEKKKIDEKNQLIVAQANDEGYCKGCKVSLLSLEREKFVLWSDLFDEKQQLPDGSWTEGGILLYQNEDLGRFLNGEWKNHLQSLRGELETLKKALPPQYPYLHTIAESKNPADLRIHLRGNPENLGELTPRRFPAILSDGQPAPFGKGSGRLELAEAVASRNNPLTARVMVNRIWQHHFGYGIVRSPSNFGRLAERPSHPELLDYLASRFVENNWSIKNMHREIMLTATYQLSSDFSEKNFAEDPNNSLSWRANRRRLDVEALRDSILYVSGSLDLAVGGSSAELTKENKRRTVYARISRNKLNPLLGLFDFPNATISNEQRSITNVPLQQLFFLNSDLIIQESSTLVERLNAETGGDDRAMIRKAYNLLFGREATETELRLGLEFVRAHGTEPVGGRGSWRKYVQVLLSSNELSFVD